MTPHTLNCCLWDYPHSVILIGFGSMAYKKWHRNGHIIELEHGWWSGAAKVTVDGQLEFKRHSPLLFMDFAFSHRFEIDGVPYVVSVICQVFKFRYELFERDEATSISDSIWSHIEFPLAQSIGFFISILFLSACLVTLIHLFC